MTNSGITCVIKIGKDSPENLGVVTPSILAACKETYQNPLASHY